MFEKLLYFVLTSLVALVGYFMHRTLSKIEDKQTEHTKSLRVTSDRVVRLEERQVSLNNNITNLTEKVNVASEVNKEVRLQLDENLGHMRQEVDNMRVTQDAQNANFGKVFMIVQKLYEKVQGPKI